MPGAWKSVAIGDGKELFDKAIDICTKIINSNPQNVHALLHRENARSCIAVYCDGSNENIAVEAVKDFSEIIEKEPFNIEAFDGRAWVQSCSRHDSDITAIEDYAKIIEIDPENINAYHNIAELKFFNGDYSGAIENFTRIIEIDASNVEAYQNRGDVKIDNNDILGAIEDYTKAIEIKPDSDCSCYLYNSRGRAKEKLHLYQAAIDDYSIAIKIANTDNSAWDYRGRAQVKEKINDFDGAVQDYLKAIEIEPNALIHYLDLSKFYCNRKEYKKAKEIFDKGIKLHPEFTNDDYSVILDDFELNELITEPIQQWPFPLNYGLSETDLPF